MSTVDTVDELFLCALEASVQINIMDLRKQGGITEEHLERVRACDVLSTEGDTLLYKVKGHTGPNFSRLAECLAIMAFVPGGVTTSKCSFEVVA